jgi:hypothetical protein
VAELLDDLDAHVHGRLGPVTLVRMERFRPDPEDQGPLGSAVDRHAEIARLHPAADGGRAQQVHRRAPDERGDEDVGRGPVDLRRCSQLKQPPLIHDRDPIAERHRLDLVVGDVDRGRRHALMDPSELGPKLRAQLGVEVREWLVEQEDLWASRQRPAHRDALSLPTRKLGRLSIEQFVECEERADLPDPLGDDVLRHLALLQPEREVLQDRLMRVQRVALEHHRDVAILWRDTVHDGIPDHHGARGRFVQSRDHPQRRGLAATRRADQDDELPVLDEQRQVVDRRRAAREDLRHLVKRDLSHGGARPPSAFLRVERAASSRLHRGTRHTRAHGCEL